MRVFFVFIIISSFLVKDIASFSWQTWFYINQQEIAQEKCENKAIPMMHCDGKCYLSKQLKKLEQKEQDHNSKTNPFQKIEKVELALRMEYISLNLIKLSSEEKSFFTYEETFSKKYLEEIFHPPSV
ncbi:MAG: hypothetical protein ACK5B9_15285 [Flavobacteriia bacterium]|jgi:hypothetical protein